MPGKTAVKVVSLQSLEREPALLPLGPGIQSVTSGSYLHFIAVP